MLRNIGLGSYKYTHTHTHTGNGAYDSFTQNAIVRNIYIWKKNM